MRMDTYSNIFEKKTTGLIKRHCGGNKGEKILNPKHVNFVSCGILIFLFIYAMFKKKINCWVNPKSPIQGFQNPQVKGFDFLIIQILCLVPLVLLILGPKMLQSCKAGRLLNTRAKMQRATWPRRTWVGSVSDKHTSAAKPGLHADGLENFKIALAAWRISKLPSRKQE